VLVSPSEPGEKTGVYWGYDVEVLEPGEPEALARRAEAHGFTILVDPLFDDEDDAEEKNVAGLARFKEEYAAAAVGVAHRGDENKSAPNGASALIVFSTRNRFTRALKDPLRVDACGRTHTRSASDQHIASRIHLDESVFIALGKILP
jgi:hypothetical protein